jgi:prepilin-type N-terminal cleavage/methylation domain-containing protein
MKRGFTLIELVMVIVVISILAAIAIPKFIDLQASAKQANCDGNIATIRSAVAAYYAKTAVDGSASFPASLDAETFTDNYFAAAELPACPYGCSYSYCSDTGVVASHEH